MCVRVCGIYVESAVCVHVWCVYVRVYGECVVCVYVCGVWNVWCVECEHACGVYPGLVLGPLSLGATRRGVPHYRDFIVHT